MIWPYLFAEAYLPQALWECDRRRKTAQSEADVVALPDPDGALASTVDRAAMSGTTVNMGTPGFALNANEEIK